MASHCGLQYFFPSLTVQLQLGCAHFLLSATGGSFSLPGGSFAAGRAGSGGLGEQLDHRFVEDRNVIGLAAADPVPVANDLFVAPAAAGIANIVLDRVVAREAAALDQAGGNQE